MKIDYNFISKFLIIIALVLLGFYGITYKEKYNDAIVKVEEYKEEHKEDLKDLKRYKQIIDHLNEEEVKDKNIENSNFRNNMSGIDYILTISNHIDDKVLKSFDSIEFMSKQNKCSYYAKDFMCMIINCTTSSLGYDSNNVLKYSGGSVGSISKGYDFLTYAQLLNTYLINKYGAGSEAYVILYNLLNSGDYRRISKQEKIERCKYISSHLQKIRVNKNKYHYEYRSADLTVNFDVRYDVDKDEMKISGISIM